MIGYLDLPSGLSGDMLLGCLIDCGWSVDRLRHTIESMPISRTEWAVQVEQVTKGPLRATRVDVLFEEGRCERRLADVLSIINGSKLPAPTRERASAIFTRLACAEAKVHGTSIEDVHFHEVGAVDAIVDIVASVQGLHELGIERLYASAVPLGHGWIQTAHGRLPLPAAGDVGTVGCGQGPDSAGTGRG